jgi:flagellar hook-associated protein 2
MRDAINKANIGVNATIINDGSSTPYRLALSTSVGGINNSLSVSVSGDAAISNLVGNDPQGVQNLKQTLEAKNANFKVNGVAITKASNTVTDAIQGVTLNLNKITTAPINLTINKDTGSINAAANSFVTAYNNLYSSLTTLSAYKTGSTTAGGLAGDKTVKQMLSEMRAILDTPVTGGAYSKLSDVGINTKQGVGLAIDTTAFSNAVASNLADVSNLFTSAGGYATNLDAWAKKSLNVTISNRTSNINDAISSISKQVDALEVRMTSIKKRYTTQFTNLNTTLAQLSSTQTFISQNLG